jgi:hypothetical protein
MFPLTQAIRSKSTGSALTPLIWLIGTVSTLCSVLYLSGAGWPAHAVLGFDAALILYFVYVYNHFLKNDTDRLHSESHLQQMKTIGLMGDSQSSGLMINAQPAGNPYLQGTDDEQH